jgi:phosphatidylinositol alpha-1,6-mannosyltransferase
MPRQDRLVVLTVGRLHPRKGQLETLEALQALAPRFRQKIEYWIVGGHSKSNYEHTLRERAAGSDLKVRFFGELPDDELDRVYDRADIFAMTSIDYRHSIEGFGLVYLEAAAHGLPVVAHTIGGVAEAVVDGVTGLCVPPDHPAQLDRRLRTTDQQRRTCARVWARPAGPGRAATHGSSRQTCSSIPPRRVRILHR